jgi:phosphoribosylglycinamide formyltransferase-1
LIKLAFLASNNGSSFRAVVGAIEAGELDASARLVVSNRKAAPALDFAREHRIKALWIPTTADPAGADARLAVALAEAEIDVVILSGYLRKLGPVTLNAFAGRVFNIHPALLPRFGGQGMYGRKVHEAVLAAGDTVSGATVHLVDGEYDHGEVIAQARVLVGSDDTPASLERRVMAAESGLFIKVLQKLTAGTLSPPEMF